MCTAGTVTYVTFGTSGTDTDTDVTSRTGGTGYLR